MVFGRETAGEKLPELSIVIVSFNVRQLLLDCIRTVIATACGFSYEIIVVDNASSDGSVEAVKEAFPEVVLIANEKNVGFAKANNQAYAISAGAYILLLNPDTVAREGAISAVLDFMRNTPDAGIAACRLLNPDGSLQKSIKKFPGIAVNLMRAFFLDRLFLEYRQSSYFVNRARKIDYATGAFLMVRKSALGRMPLLNPLFFMYAEEKDISLRLKNSGWNTYYVPFGEIIHYGGKSTDQMSRAMFLALQESQIRFFTFHFRGLRRNILVWTYWFSLCTSFLACFPLAVNKRGRRRLILFALAVRKYPAVASKIKNPF